MTANLCTICIQKTYAQSSSEKNQKIESPSDTKETNDVETSTHNPQKLKESFQRLLDYQKNVNEVFGNVEVIYDGEITVTKEDTYYTLTFPHIYVSGLEQEGAYEQKNSPPKMVLDIGVISINATPDERPGYWKMSFAMPEEMILYDSLKGTSDENSFSFTIGEQRAIALFDNNSGYFIKTDLNLSDLKFFKGGVETNVRVGGFQLYTNFEEQENGTLSGPGHFMISNLHIASPDVQYSTLDIGELKLGFSIDKVRYPDLETYQENILKHQETFKNMKTQNNTASEDNEATSPSEVKNILDMFKDLYDFEMEGISFAYSAKDIDIKALRKHDDSNKNPDTQKLDYLTMHIANVLFGMSISGIGTDEGNLRFDWNFDGFKTTPEDPEIIAFVPQKLKTSIEVKNLPYSTLSTLLGNTLDSISQNPKATNMVALSVLPRLPAILSQAGTQIVVEHNKIKNDTYDITIDGEIVTDLSAMFGAKSQFDILFKGLDTLKDLAQEYSMNEDNQNAEKYKKLVLSLEQLKAWGKPIEGQNGNTSYIYAITIGPTRQVIINGLEATPSHPQPLPPLQIQQQ